MLVAISHKLFLGNSVTWGEGGWFVPISIWFTFTLFSFIFNI